MSLTNKILDPFYGTAITVKPSPNAGLIAVRVQDQYGVVCVQMTHTDARALANQLLLYASMDGPYTGSTMSHTGD